jgi:hypothetical protein
MAAQGADVIKVEPPGDWIRHGRNRVRGHSPASLAVNAGKRSLRSTSSKRRRARRHNGRGQLRHRRRASGLALRRGSGS